MLRSSELSIQAVENVVQNTVDIAAGIFAAELFPDFNGFIKGDSGRDVFHETSSHRWQA